MKRIIEVINPNHIFGFGQLNHEPKDYYYGSNGILYNWLKGEPDAVIKTDSYDINVKVAGGFCLQISTADGWRINVDKQLLNTASPECCVAAAEEQLRIIDNMKPGVQKLEARRKAAKLTRAELSKLSGVHAQAIARYELGERDIANASYSTIIKLASALQCKPEDIV